MSLTTATTETAQIVSVHVDRIDAAIAIQFKDDMRIHTRDGPERVILDLSSVDFIDSSGLGAIVAAMKHIGEGRRLDLAGLTPTVEKVFHLTRMDTVFTLYPTLGDAINDE